jgi:predicted ATPase
MKLGVLGVNGLPPALTKAVMAKAQGNPFLAGQLVNHLKDQGVFKIIFGSCILAPNVDLTQLNLPETLQGVIISRIDRYPICVAFNLLKVSNPRKH